MGQAEGKISPCLGCDCGVEASRICSLSVSLCRSNVQNWDPSAVPRHPASAIGGMQGLRVGTGDSGEGPPSYCTQGALT